MLLCHCCSAYMPYWLLLPVLLLFILYVACVIYYYYYCLCSHLLSRLHNSLNNSSCMERHMTLPTFNTLHPAWFSLVHELLGY
jgi:hypothetical protein